MKIITGMGRSGTSFISKMINDCTEKTSKHEYIKRSLKGNFNLKPDMNHIEVNSFCRYDLHSDKAEFTLLLRRPVDISLSISKRYGEAKRGRVIKEMSDWYVYLSKNIDHAKNVFFFERYTKESKYLHDLLKSVGCERIDMDILKYSISLKVNSSASKFETVAEAYTKEEIDLITKMEKEYEMYKNIYNR